MAESKLHLLYIDITHVPENKNTPQYTGLHIQNTVVYLTKYHKIVSENENTIVIEENVDGFTRNKLYYKTKEYAQQILNDINKKDLEEVMKPKSRFVFEGF